MATATMDSYSIGGSAFSLIKYLRTEVTRGYQLENDEERYKVKREKVYTFFKVPRELEKFMSYGFFHCLDSFLFVFTFLPIRFAMAAFALLFRTPLILIGMAKSPGKGRWMYPAESIDLLKGGILIVCVHFSGVIDTSVLYHMIKSQSVIKLYLFFNMLEVGDRLLSAFGQDTMDALFWTATEPPTKKRVDFPYLILHFTLACIYVFLHAALVLLQATTINVAINASNKALFTIMMSNNFVELKGAIFKKFDKNNLFQVSCSDVRERFHLFALLFVVVVQTMKEYGWKEESFWSLSPDCVIMLMVEFVVDWIKHCFITRFNEVPGDVYKDYTTSLAYDLAQTKQKYAFSDHSDSVSRRMGFIPLPLGVVMIRVIGSAILFNGGGAPIIFVLAYLCLVTFRILCSIVILGKACDLIDLHQQQSTKHQHDPERHRHPSSSQQQQTSSSSARQPSKSGGSGGGGSNRGSRVEELIEWRAHHFFPDEDGDDEAPFSHGRRRRTTTRDSNGSRLGDATTTPRKQVEAQPGRKKSGDGEEVSHQREIQIVNLSLGEKQKRPGREEEREEAAGQKVGAEGENGTRRKWASGEKQEGQSNASRTSPTAQLQPPPETADSGEMKFGPARDRCTSEGTPKGPGDRNRTFSELSTTADASPTRHRHGGVASLGDDTSRGGGHLPDLLLRASSPSSAAQSASQEQRGPRRAEGDDDDNERPARGAISAESATAAAGKRTPPQAATNEGRGAETTTSRETESEDGPCSSLASSALSTPSRAQLFLASLASNEAVSLASSSDATSPLDRPRSLSTPDISQNYEDDWPPRFVDDDYTSSDDDEADGGGGADLRLSFSASPAPPPSGADGGVRAAASTASPSLSLRRRVLSGMASAPPPRKTSRSECERVPVDKDRGAFGKRD